MNYPKRVIVRGESNKNIVKAIQKRLNEVGCGPIDVDGDFGAKTLAAVKLFQATRRDHNGQPLIVDGKIGAITWSTLFGADTVVVSTAPPSTFLTELVKVANGELGVKEVPLGSNSGPKVNQYLNSVGLGPGFAWCAAFVYYCADKAAANLGKTNPLFKTGGVLNHWNNTTGRKLLTADAVDNPALIKVGSIFIRSYGSGKGHTGIVTNVRSDGYIDTIEGNSNTGGSREGIGVFALTRKINSIEKGFIIY